ncbi:heme biosynthesis protein HemY, partial [Mesorhizobium sp. M1E.F.Ca.ET.063.01.1.1]
IPAAPAVPAEKAIDIVPDASAAKPAAEAPNGMEKETAAASGDGEAFEQASEPPRLPDDPGVAPEDEAEKSPRRFRLF